MSAPLCSGAGGFAWNPRIVQAEESAGGAVEFDRLGNADLRRGHGQRMAAVGQSLLQGWFETILNSEQVGRPLMVDSRLSERLRQRKAKVEAANERLNNLADDGWAAGGADRKHWLA